MNSKEQTEMLRKVAGILGYCFIFSVALILYWFLFYLLAGDWAYSIHSRWFELSRREFGLMMYYGMAFVKIYGFMYFLLPYIAVKLILRKKENNE